MCPWYSFMMQVHFKNNSISISTSMYAHVEFILEGEILILKNN